MSASFVRRLATSCSRHWEVVQVWQPSELKEAVSNPKHILLLLIVRGQHEQDVKSVADKIRKAQLPPRDLIGYGGVSLQL